jgi:hypothetical protein
MARLSPNLREHLRLFAFSLANGTLDPDLPDDPDYDSLFSNPSDFEQVFAIWSNNLDLDEEGRVTNGDYADHRAAQYIRRFLDPDFAVMPPFEPWELELHEA